MLEAQPPALLAPEGGPGKIERKNELFEPTSLDRDKEIDNLKAQARRSAYAARSRNRTCEKYEAELNVISRRRKQDRTKLNAEIDQLRLRNSELDQAVPGKWKWKCRRERAELGRERTRLDRMPD